MYFVEKFRVLIENKKRFAKIPNEFLNTCNFWNYTKWHSAITNTWLQSDNYKPPIRALIFIFKVAKQQLLGDLFSSILRLRKGPIESPTLVSTSVCTIITNVSGKVFSDRCSKLSKIRKNGSSCRKIWGLKCQIFRFRWINLWSIFQ